MENKTSMISRMYKILKPEKKAIIIISILAIIVNIGEVIKPYLIKIVIDNYLSAEIWQIGTMTIRNYWCYIYWNCFSSEIS